MKTISLKHVIASLLRDTNNSIDAGWYSDIYEWMFEGMKELETKYQLVTRSADIEVVGHIAELPVDFVREISVEDEYGRRLRYGSKEGDITKTVQNTDSVYQPDMYHTVGSISPYLDGDVDLHSVRRLGVNAHYYQMELDKVILSFPTGLIRLHYFGYPIDAEGYPLVPDLQVYKQALKWYVLLKLIGAGYKHPTFDYQFVNSQWLIYCPRAIQRMKAVSVDRAERMVYSINRLVLPQHAWSDSFTNLEQVQEIVTHTR